MGNSCTSLCTKRKKITAIEAVIVDENESKNLILNEEKRELDDNNYVYLRRFSKARQEWYCQDRNCMVAHDIQFTSEYFQTKPISETEELKCNVCQKVHKIKWRFIEDRGIIIG